MLVDDRRRKERARRGGGVGKYVGRIQISPEASRGDLLNGNDDGGRTEWKRFFRARQQETSEAAPFPPNTNETRMYRRFVLREINARGRKT